MDVAPLTHTEWGSRAHPIPCSPQPKPLEPVSLGQGPPLTHFLVDTQLVTSLYLQAQQEQQRRQELGAGKHEAGAFLCQLSPQLRQWYLGWAWQTWRHQAVRLRVARRLQQQEDSWFLPRYRGQGGGGPCLLFPKPVPLLNRRVPARCHQGTFGFKGGGRLA